VDREVTDPGFWNDQRNAQKVSERQKIRAASSWCGG
jgi:hypothetical protein